MLFPSGVAAIACALMAVLKPGDRLLMPDSTYDPTRSFCDQMLNSYGIETIYYDPCDTVRVAVRLADEKVRAIFLESPGSLTFEVQDIPAITAIARERGIVTLLDNTWATPLFFPAMAHGVDITILACTKYIVGHSDVMMGSVTARWRSPIGSRTSPASRACCIPLCPIAPAMRYGSATFPARPACSVSSSTVATKPPAPR